MAILLLMAGYVTIWLHRKSKLDYRCFLIVRFIHNFIIANLMLKA
jgi:hypothetical protein